jgi:hypothetical protein
MTTLPITNSQRMAAKAVGFAYLISLTIVVYVNFWIHDPLIAGDDAAATARNILAHEQLFRVGITGDLIYCICIVVQIAALYVVLRPVSQGLSLLAALWRFAWVLVWLVMTLNLFDTLRLISGESYLNAIETAKLQAMARLKLSTRFDYYYAGLIFGCLASTLCAWLWFKSRYIPRAIAVFGIVSSAFCVACTIIFYIFPDFDKIVNLWWFDTPMGIFDIILSFWLIIRGLSPKKTI